MLLTYRQLLCVAVLVTGLAGANERDWPIVSTIDPASYIEVRSLVLEAENGISDEYATKEVRPVLEFRCEPRSDASLRTLVDWRRFISSFNTDLTFRSDGGEPLVLKFGVDRSNKITASREAGDDELLLEMLEGATSLEVSVTPYAEASVAVHFDVAGLRDGLKLLREACNPDS